MATTPSNAFAVQVVPVPVAGAVNVPGDSIPTLAQLVALDNAKWTFDIVAQKVSRNGVDTKQPYVKVEHLYIELRDAAWMARMAQPDAIWIKDTDHGYAWYNHTTGLWGYADHGPRMFFP
jgi:hypothetical protein